MPARGPCPAPEAHVSFLGGPKALGPVSRTTISTLKNHRGDPVSKPPAALVAYDHPASLFCRGSGTLIGSQLFQRLVKNAPRSESSLRAPADTEVACFQTSVHVRHFLLEPQAPAPHSSARPQNPAGRKLSILRSLQCSNSSLAPIAANPGLGDVFEPALRIEQLLSQ